MSLTVDETYVNRDRHSPTIMSSVKVIRLCLLPMSLDNIALYLLKASISQIILILRLQLLSTPVLERWNSVRALQVKLLLFSVRQTFSLSPFTPPVTPASRWHVSPSSRRHHTLERGISARALPTPPSHRRPKNNKALQLQCRALPQT